MRREHEIKVRVNADELAMLDEMRIGVSRAAHLRNLIRKRPNASDVADRIEALAILTAMAREGRVTAAIALERALRGEAGGGDDGEHGNLLDQILQEAAEEDPRRFFDPPGS